MYGNFTSNLYKLSFTHYVFKYSLEIQPPIPENLEFSDSFEQNIQKTLLSIHKIPAVILTRTLYTNQQLANGFTICLLIEGVSYLVVFQSESSPLLTEKSEQKRFLKAVFFQSLQELKYLHFENAFYNPFEVFEEKNLEITRWSGFSYQIKTLYNDFALQISPKTLVFSKKNCLSLLNGIRESSFEVSKQAIKRVFYGMKVHIKPHKDLNPDNSGFFRIHEVLYPESAEDQDSSDIETKIEAEIKVSLIPLSNGKKPLVIPLKYCTLIGYLEDNRFKPHFREPLQQISTQISHFMNIITRNPASMSLFYDWKLSLTPIPNNMQLYKLDSNQILLSSMAKNLNLISYSLSSFQFEQQYKAIFCESPLLNFPSLENWIFFLHYENMDMGDLILNNFHIIVKKFGYNVLKPQCVLVDSFAVSDWLEKIEENTQKTHQLAMVMIPSRVSSTEFYEKVKTLLTGKFGVPSQFFHTKSLETNKENEGFFLRILSQISAKLGFAPWALKDLYFSNFPTMVIGINLRKGEKSIVISIVGSMNKDFSKYWSAFTVINEKNSYLKEMGMMVLESLVKFIAVHAIFPEYLVIFRDGEFMEQELEEKAFISKLIGQYKEKERSKSELFLTFAKAKVCEKDMMFSVENINNAYAQKISNPYTGSLLKINGKETSNTDRFLLFLQRNDSEHEIMRPTKFELSFLGDTQKYKHIIPNLQNFCFHLVFLNFSFSSRTSLPAPMQYAYKLGVLAEIFERNTKTKEEFTIIQDNLKGLSAKGKLYFI